MITSWLDRRPFEWTPEQDVPAEVRARFEERVEAAEQDLREKVEDLGLELTVALAAAEIDAGILRYPEECAYLAFVCRHWDTVEKAHR